MNNSIMDSETVVSSEDEEGGERWEDVYWDKSVDNKNIQPDTTGGSESEQKRLSVVKPQSLMTRMELNDHKAGMEGLDKNRINQIIYENSKGSKFFENEKKKEEQMKCRIEDQQRRKGEITPAQLKQGLYEADKVLEDLERSFDLSRTIVHVDMDAFYAAVEMRDDPSLKTKPMAVGGIGMLSTSNYLARKYGVRAAMPGFIALKLCPDLVIVKSNFDKYRAVSKEIRAVMEQYDPNFSPMSLDETYLDFTQHLILRQNYCDKERSYLVRNNPTEGDEFCQCDLNEHLRKQVIFGNDCEQSEKKMSQATGNSDNNFNQEEGNDEIQDENENIMEDVKLSQSSLIVNPSSQGSYVFSDSSQIEKEMSSICDHCHKSYPSYSIKIFGTDVEDAVNEMRCRIEQRTRLTASAGIAPNTMLAKVCSDRNKPNGQFRIEPTREAVQNFINDLPIRKISGIGKVTEQMLNALNIVTCTHLYQERALLYHLYSDISFNYFMRICLGIGSTTVERDSERKSMSTERTFRDTSNPSDLYLKCFELCESLVSDLKSEGLKGKTVTLKIKTSKFEVKTRAHSLRDYTWDIDVIHTTCKDLLKTEIQQVQPNPLVLRLMGVRMSNLLHHSQCPKDKQETLTGFIRKLTEKQVEQNPGPSNEINNNSTPRVNSTSKVINKDEDLESGKISKLLIQSSKFLCPICSREISCSNEVGMNVHIDKCLQNEQNSQLPVKERTQLAKSQDVNQNSDLNKLNFEADSPKDNKPENSKLYTCPICNIKKHFLSLDEFNFHVDACLSKGTIKEILHEQRSIDVTSKKRRLDSSNNKSLPNAKRSKGENSKGTVIKTKSIETFFKS